MVIFDSATREQDYLAPLETWSVSEGRVNMGVWGGFDERHACVGSGFGRV